MLGFRAKLPISEADRQWADSGFDRLSKMLGYHRMLQAKVVLPNEQHFPDPYDRSVEAAERMFCRVCNYMKVDRSTIEFEVFSGGAEELSAFLPYWKGGGGCAGLYVHADADNEKMVVALRESQMHDPLAVVATLAHELGHVILLGGGLLDASVKDMEPLTDLLTVFLGFGIFNANCAARFQQWQDERKQGWSMQRLGYLPEQVYGYALARFARERNEPTPPWAGHLSTNVRAYFKKSMQWLQAEERRARAPIN